MPKEVTKHLSLADALFTLTQQKVFSILFGQPEKSFYLTEIMRLAKIGRGGIQRELTKLESVGLVSVFGIGNQRHFQANAKSPLFNELVSIVRKTVGLRDPLIEALDPISEDIAYAFVYGSVAKGTDRSSSDVDIMVISDKLNLEDIFLALAPLELQLGRTVNPTLFTEKEFLKKRDSKGGFVSKVLAGPITELIGQPNAY